MSGTRTPQSPADNIGGGAGLDATFMLDANSPFEFDIFARQAPNNFSSYCSGTLTNQTTGSTVFTSIFPVLGTLPGTTSHRTGTLVPGSYRLAISHTNVTSTGTFLFSSGYSAAFAVPEPASFGIAAMALSLAARPRRR